MLGVSQNAAYRPDSETYCIIDIENTLFKYRVPKINQNAHAKNMELCFVIPRSKKIMHERFKGLF